MYLGYAHKCCLSQLLSDRATRFLYYSWNRNKHCPIFRITLPNLRKIITINIIHMVMRLKYTEVL